MIGWRLGQESWIQALTFDANLVASELVTNALNASCTELELTLTVHRSRIRLSVYDNAPGMPRVIEAGPTDIRGRGLALTVAIALDVGFGPAPVGKTVWADLSVEVDQFDLDALLSWCDEPPGVTRV